MANKEVTQKVELCLFGRDPESNFGAFPIRYVAPFLFIDVKQSELVRFNSTRYFARVLGSREHLKNALVTHKIEGIEAERLQNALSELPTISSQLAVGVVGESIREAVLDAADRRTSEYLADQLAFRAELAKAISEADPLIGTRLNEALCKLSDSLQETGLERNTQLREAKGLLTEAATSGWLNHTSTWFASAVATWCLTESPSETLSVMRHAIGAHKAQPVAQHFANRFMAFLTMMDGEADRSRAMVAMAMTTYKSPEAYVEGYQYGTLTGDATTANDYAQASLESQPADLLFMLSEDAPDNILGGLVRAALRQQVLCRQEAKGNLEIWTNAVKNVEETEIALGTELEIPVDLHHGHKMVAPSLEASDVITAGYLKRWTQESGAALLTTMRSALQEEEVQRTLVVQGFAQKIEQLWESREQTKKSLANSSQQAEYRARTALAAADKDGERAQRGCAMGGGLGCAIFSGYLIVSLVLGMRGVEVGISSPIGMAAIGTASLPIVLAIVLQIIAGMKRMMKEGEIQSEVAKFSEAQRQALKQADEAYETNIDPLKERHEQAKERLAECQALIKKLPAHRGVAKKPPEEATPASAA